MMPMSIPSTQELIQGFLTTIENQIGVDVPLASRSFIRTLSTALGLTSRSIFAYIRDRSKANLAVSAESADLLNIAREYNLTLHHATRYTAQAVIAVPDRVTVPAQTKLYSDLGFIYYTSAAATAPHGANGSGALLTLYADTAGADANVDIGGKLYLASPKTDWADFATVSAITAEGKAQEDIEPFRQRLLDVIRGTQSGTQTDAQRETAYNTAGTAYDYRVWAQAVKGVKRAFPFTGTFIGSTADAIPGDRTVYIEALDGDPSSALLTAVRSALLFDPDTGKSREILGLIADNLYVKPIVSRPVDVSVSGLRVQSGSTSSAQSAVKSALAAFLNSLAPYISGVDPETDKADVLSLSALSAQAQKAAATFNGYFISISFSIDGVPYSEYILPNNTLLNLGELTWLD
jgi:uncharacterized phage protein gp47/JayE